MTLFEALFSPGTIAVIGASSDSSKIGHAVMDNLVNQGFPGKIFPVNPKATEIMGYKSYPDLDSLPEPVDIAVITLPAKVTVNVVKDCVRKKVKFVIAVAGGFSEAGEEGKALESELKKAIDGSETRVIGPNTVGILFPHSRVNTALTPGDRIWYPGEGKVAFISQSGALGLLVMDSLTETGMGISGFVNIGNRSDIDEVDLMKMFNHSRETNSIVMYLESISNGDRFFEAAREISPVTPIVALKTGRSKAASVAASFHTGAMASDDRVTEGVLRQAGVIRAYNETELLDFGKALAYSLPMKGGRVAVITTAGGVGVLTTDLLSIGDDLPALSLSQFAESEISKLKENVLSIASVNNPIDLTADGSNESYGKILDILTQSEEVDGIIAYALPQTPKIDQSILEPLKKAASLRPMVVGVIGNRLSKDMLKDLEKAEIPAYPSIERTVRSMKALYQYSLFRRRLSNE